MLINFDVSIESLNNRKRTIRIYLPENYFETDKHYPVLYMHDGQNLFLDKDASYKRAWRLNEFLDNNSYQVIIVGIDSSKETITQRLDEYGPYRNENLIFAGQAVVAGGEANQYLDFLVNQLKPLIDSKYRTITTKTAIAGSSMGGLISLYAYCCYPDIYSKVAALSTAFFFNQKEMEKLCKEIDFSKLDKLYLSAGTAEESAVNTDLTFLQSTDIIYNILKNKVKDLKYEIIEEGKHKEADWEKLLPNIFEFFYNDTKGTNN